MHWLILPFRTRYIAFTVSCLATLALAWFTYRNWPHLSAILSVPLAIAASLALLGTHDILQKRHSILRNYPIAAHLRFLLEQIRPEMRQYFFEGEKDGTPFPRDKRAIVYQRAKMQLDKRPFGTQYDVYADAYEWVNHSIAARSPAHEPFRITIGLDTCAEPYAASVFNISAMSYGALSANAIRSLNKGAKLGGFAHDTGEGGVSPYHLEFGGDLIWEIGSGYFGCRNRDSSFSPEKFADRARHPSIRMVEIKISQGAKPGHGGVLPAAKISREISEIRGIEMGRDCVSPPHHSAFSTPIELLYFVDELRRLAGGKPSGFKLCIGHPWEFMAIIKAMLETGITPDFIVIDGKEGGTGAAPLEFADHIGMPLRDGLSFANNALTGAGLRNKIKLGASGKIVTAFDITRAIALGADWCNAARGFMFAVGCIQAQSCHTGNCPTGVATQDPMRQRAIVVADKATRVANYHKATVEALAELIAAAGLDHPAEIRPNHISQRVTASEVRTYAELYPVLEHGELLDGIRDPVFAEAWKLARPDSFQRAM
ncbi:MAG: FMN-binding glutamate synthase family protein [Hyphomicrobiaceae bacterium]